MEFYCSACIININFIDGHSIFADKLFCKTPVAADTCGGETLSIFACRHPPPPPPPSLHFTEEDGHHADFDIIVIFC